MHIIALVAVVTLHSQLVLIEVAFVAVLTHQLPVCPRYFELRILVMIEADATPLGRRMAVLTLHPKPPFMAVIALVATDAYFFYLG